MVVNKVDIATGGLEELGGGNVVGKGFVELHFGLCNRVDKRRDEFEESSYIPRDCGRS